MSFELKVRQLSPVGAEIVGADADALLEEETIPSRLMDLLEESGVLVFRELGLDDAQLSAFGRRLGPTVKKKQKGWSEEYPDVFTVSLDEQRTAGAYMKSTFDWHIDGMTLDIPSKASILTARALPAEGNGGSTMFASTYAAYSRLSEAEKDRFEALKVMHSMELSHRRHDPNPSPEILARLRSEPPRIHPLVWKHRSGRRSLVLGTTAAYVEGMPEKEGIALLDDLLERSTTPEQVYTHDWAVGDVVIWDNRGVMHRVVPYAESSGREMHRVNLIGDEPVE